MHTHTHTHTHTHSLSPGGDVRERYYGFESEHRRKNGTAEQQGRANRYFTGDPVHLPSTSSNL